VVLVASRAFSAITITGADGSQIERFHPKLRSAGEDPHLVLAALKVKDFDVHAIQTSLLRKARDGNRGPSRVALVGLG
jgi:hypothetical protein